MNTFSLVSCCSLVASKVRAKCFYDRIVTLLRHLMLGSFHSDSLFHLDNFDLRWSISRLEIYLLLRFVNMNLWGSSCASTSSPAWSLFNFLRLVILVN